MNLAFLNNRDFWAGMMLIAIGIGAIFVSRDYALGSAQRMGPGFFPTALGGIVALFGVCVTVMGLRGRQKIQAVFSPRALVVLPLALVLFGVLMERAGFIPALAVLIFGSAAAGREFRFGEVLLLTVFMTTLSAVVFIWGLGLSYPLIKGF